MILAYMYLLQLQKAEQDSDLTAAQHKVDKLEKLCRALQEERAKMLTQLKDQPSTAQV